MVAGLLGCWVAGLLGCWVAGLLGCLPDHGAHVIPSDVEGPGGRGGTSLEPPQPPGPSTNARDDIQAALSNSATYPCGTPTGVTAALSSSAVRIRTTRSTGTTKIFP